MVPLVAALGGAGSADHAPEGRNVRGFGGVEESDPVSWRWTIAASALRHIDRCTRRSLALAGERRFGPAVALGREAVSLARREVGAGGGADARLALAVCLHNLGLVAAWAGKRHEALAAADEAVALHRDLSSADPGAGAPRLAESLDSLGTRLATAGRHEDALRAARESVALYRRSASAGASVHRAALARVLNNLSIRLTDTGRHEESLAATLEALEIYRALDGEEPGRHRGGLVHTLANLALRQARAGHKDAVLAPALESADLLAALPDAHPSHDFAALAETLRWLARRLSRTGHRAEARLLKRAAAQARRRASRR